MIHHVVLIRLRPEVDEAQTTRFLERAREVLGPIPGVHNLRVGRNIKGDAAFPCVLVMDFETPADLEAYQLHSEHQRFLKDVIGPLIAEKQVFDYACWR